MITKQTLVYIEREVARVQSLLYSYSYQPPESSTFYLKRIHDTLDSLKKYITQHIEGEKE